MCLIFSKKKAFMCLIGHVFIKNVYVGNRPQLNPQKSPKYLYEKKVGLLMGLITTYLYHNPSNHLNSSCIEHGQKWTDFTYGAEISNITVRYGLTTRFQIK